MEVIQEVQGNGGRKLYIYNDNIYYLNREHQSSIYLRCKFRSCCARCVWTNGQGVRETAIHNHEPAAEEAKLEIFKESVTKRAKMEGGSLKVIFLEEQVRFPEIVGAIGSYGQYANIMRRARQSVLPPVPRNWQELENHLSNPQYRNLVLELGPEHNEFYNGVYDTDDGKKFVYFSSPSLIRRASGQPIHLHMDGTFKCVPRLEGFAQLFMIHIIFDDKPVPCVFVLMQSKTRVSYQSVLRLFLAQVEGAEIESVMADFENGLRAAVRLEIPGAELRGCHFHFSRAVLKKARKMGLWQTNATQIKISMSLPLLPANDIADGINFIENQMPRNELTLRFIGYLRTFWIPQNISVFGLRHRTNNSVESFHSVLNRILGAPHGNVYQLIEKIKLIEYDAVKTIIRHDSMVPERRQRPAYRRCDTTIRNAQREFEGTRDLGIFFRTVAHINDSITRPLPLLDSDDSDNAEVDVALELAPPELEFVRVDEVDPLLDVPELPVHRNICSVCMIGNVEWILLDCGHAILCSECSVRFGPYEEINSCPLCRQVILNNLQRIYLV